MKIHSNDFKNKIKELGKEIDVKISYTIDNETTELGIEELNSVVPHYEGGILKSVMKQLDLNSNVNIPLGTEINCQFGVKVNGNYEYLNFGNYIVYSSEEQKDTKSYKLICYDKMLNSMVDYESMGITYPISIRDYIGAICNHLHIQFANSDNTFANYNKTILSELYLDGEGNSIGYTFRDVLDDLAQVTASTICINEVTNQLEIRYITNTNDSINESYLKDTNVNIGEKYGPINSIVLSRSAESDNVYLTDDDSVTQNGLCEIKIKDNQILNGNNRSDYLPDILGVLDGLEYYTNDYVSPGICYYNLCDGYTVSIEDNNYYCVMLNDEVIIENGLVENIYTEMPEESETDYTKADKTDRRINQTYLIVDKQNQEINAVISQTTDSTNPDSMVNKVTSLNLRVGELESKISDVADLTTSGETSYATLDLSNINASEPIMIKIRPIGNSITKLYPRNNLYPSSNLFSTTRKIRFHNNTTNENIDYELPDDLLYYDSNNYDEFYLDADTLTCQVTKKCGYNADGSVKRITQRINNYTYPLITLTDGNYTISLLGYDNGYIFVRLMAQNLYTTQFYTKVETNSRINQKATEIDLGVNQKLSNYSTTTQMNSAINIKANQITSSVSETYATKTTTNQLSSRITQNATNISSEVTRATNSENDLSSQITQTATSITSTVSATYETKSHANSTYETKSNAQSQYTQINQTASEISTTVSQKVGNNEIISKINQSAESVKINASKVNISGVVSFINSGSDTIDGGKITTGSITTNQISSNGISNDKIKITGDNGIVAGINNSSSSTKLNGNKVTVTGDNGIIKQINGNNHTTTIDGGKITTGTITANQVASDIITTNNFSAQNINASKITAGTLNGNNVTITNLNASNIKSGTLTSRAINNTNFTVSTGGTIKATSGTIGGWTLSSTSLSGSGSGYSATLTPSRITASNSYMTTSNDWFSVINNASDKNFKNNIETLDEKYEEFYNDLKPISFYFNQGIDNGKKHFGFIAQDILKSEEKIDEDLALVDKPETDNYYSLYKQEIIALNTWQIQKIKSIIDKQQEEIDFLKQEIELLKRGN